VRGSSYPLALVHGQLAAEWVARMHPLADESWLLAARAHHLHCWLPPRSQFELGEEGYLGWKRDQRTRRAAAVGALLAEVEYGPAVIERVQSLVHRDHLTIDHGSQAVEDAACLVVIEMQLSEKDPDGLDADLVDAIRHVAKRMSPAALAAAAHMPLGEQTRSILTAAIRPWAD